MQKLNRIRLEYLRHNQSKLRTEAYHGLMDAIDNDVPSECYWDADYFYQAHI